MIAKLGGRSTESHLEHRSHVFLMLETCSNGDGGKGQF